MRNRTTKRALKKNWSIFHEWRETITFRLRLILKIVLTNNFHSANLCTRTTMSLSILLNIVDSMVLWRKYKKKKYKWFHPFSIPSGGFSRSIYFVHFAFAFPFQCFVVNNIIFVFLPIRVLLHNCVSPCMTLNDNLQFKAERKKMAENSARTRNAKCSFASIYAE